MVIARTIYQFNRTAIGIGAQVSFVIGYNHGLIHHHLEPVRNCLLWK